MRPVDSMDVMYVLRAMAWQRAKGELRSILLTYHGEEEKYKGMQEAIDYIVQMVEEDGLC